MFIDEKGKLFGKINIIDLCIAIFVVLAIVVSVFKFGMTPSGSDSKNSAQTKYVVEYNLKISNIRDYTYSQFEKGEKIYATVTDRVMGKIKDIKKTPAKGNVLTTDGAYKEAIHPERYDVILTIEATGTVSKKGFVSVGGQQLLAHDEMSIATRKYKTTATIVDYELKEKVKVADKKSK